MGLAMHLGNSYVNFVLEIRMLVPESYLIIVSLLPPRIVFQLRTTIIKNNVNLYLLPESLSASFLSSVLILVLSDI